MKTLPAFLIISALLAQVSCASAAPTVTETALATYISGGIGSDEAAQMKSMASQYGLEILSVVKSAQRDQYTADFNVLVTDRKGTVFIDAIAEGPFFLANLPAGNYQLKITQDGAVKAQRITLKKGVHQRLVFTWQE